MNSQNIKVQFNEGILVRGKLLNLEQPLVMGIINATPDSFHRDSRVNGIDQALMKAERHLKEGAHMLDIGAYSSRPGASDIPQDEERSRLLPLVEKISSAYPEVIISVDTFRSAIAKEAVEAGAHIINDISAGDDDPEMLKTIAQLGVPVILMHKKGVPLTMQENPIYSNVTQEVLDYLSRKLLLCKKLGINDIIVDPGFGFGKTMEHNFQLMAQLEVFAKMGHPVLVGISRKGMIWKTLGTSVEEALNGTTALHSIALMKGAKILRVHDVKEAVETIRLIEALKPFS